MFSIFSKDQWLVLAAVILGVSMNFLESSILPVALPSIQKDLGLSDTNLQWIINIYFLTRAGFVICAGKLSDIYGSRNIYIVGLVVFSVASVIGGMAQNALQLLTARGAQGIGGALIVPSMTAILVHKFSSSLRGRAIGVSTGISSCFLMLGPLLGGCFTEYLTWRWTFFVNIFIACLAVVLTLKYVPNYPGKKVKIDFVSLLLLAGALVFLTLGGVEMGRLGWRSPYVQLYILGGIFSAFLLYLYYKIRNEEEPFFDFSLFKKIDFSIGSIHFFIAQFLIMNTVILPIFFQEGMGFSPVLAGGVMVITSLPMLVASPIAGYLSDRYGLAIPTMLGFMGLSISFSLLIVFSITHNFILIIIALPIFGCSFSPIFTPVKSIVIGSVAPEKRGLAYGIVSTVRCTGATVGMVMLGAIYSGVQVNQMELYIHNQYALVTSEEKEEVRLIYSGNKTNSYEGLNSSRISAEGKAAAYLALRGISTVSLGFSILGFGLIFLKRETKARTKLQLKKNQS